MENGVAVFHSELELFKYFQKVRLEECVSNALAKYNKEQPNDSALGNFWKSLTNSTQKALNEYNKAKAELEKFNAKNKCMTKEEALNAIQMCFSSDTLSINKIVFAINLVTDSEYNFFENGGLTTPSMLLFGNYTALIEIKKELESYFVKIAKPGLSTKQLVIAAGVIAGAIVGTYYLPIARIGGVAASANTTTSLLKGIGFAADMQKGVGLLTLGTILTSTAFIGGTFLAMDAYNKNEVKKEFRKMSGNTQSMHLATQCVVIKHLKKALPASEFKEELDKMLKSMNELKGDLDFYRYVQKENVAVNDERIKQFHRFDLLVGTIV